MRSDERIKQGAWRLSRKVTELATVIKTSTLHAPVD